MPFSPAEAAAPALAPGKTAGDESFPVAWLLAPGERPLVRAYYAFARLADDIADAPDLEPDDKLRRLDALEAGLRSDVGDDPAARLHRALTARGLPLALAGDLLTAFRADARGADMADWAALMAYCERSAVPVGRFLLALHGEAHPGAAPAADALCKALQVLNHIQDCGTDMARLRRCYLPADWRAEAGCPPALLQGAHAAPPLRAVLDRTLAATDTLLAEAAPLPGLLSRRGLRAQAAATVSVARALRRRLAGADPLAVRVAPGAADWTRALLSGLAWGLRP